MVLFFKIGLKYSVKGSGIRIRRNLSDDKIQHIPKKTVRMIKRDDSTLVKCCRDGDTTSFEALVDKYQRPIFNLVYRMCHNTEDARDVTQGVFIRAFQKLNTFDLDKKFFSWLYRIAINESLNFLAQKKKMVEIPPAISDENSDPEDILARNEICEQIQRVLMTLKPKYRILIILKHFQNFSYTQIASMMDLPVKTVKSRLYSARQILGQVLVRNGIIYYD